MGKVRFVRVRGARPMEYVIPEVAQCRNAGRRAVIIVPEQYTLQAELELLEGLNVPGLIDITVLSPSRLQYRVREFGGSDGRQPLDAGGLSMIVARAMAEHRSELIFYKETAKRAAVRSSTAAKIADTISELREGGAAPDTLAECAADVTNEADRAKLTDLKLLWEAAEQLAAGRFADSEARVRETCARMADSGVLRGTDIWVAGFDTIRPSLCAILLSAVPEAASMTVMMVCAGNEAPDNRVFSAQRRSLASLMDELTRAGVPWTEERHDEDDARRDPALCYLSRNLFADDREAPWRGKTDAVGLYAAPDPYAETEYVIRRLHEWHALGIPWNRMAVAMPRGCAGAAMTDASMTVAGIPHYMMRSDRQDRHGLCRMLTGALRCVTERFDRGAVIYCLRSGFSPVTGDDAWKLENYAVEHGIRWSKWTKPFRYGKDAEEMEILRQRLTEPLLKLKDALDGTREAGAAVEAVFTFLEDIHAYDRLREREEELIRRGMLPEAVLNRQIWKQLMALLDQAWTLLGGSVITADDLTEILLSGMLGMTASSLPEGGAAVIVGEAGHMLTGRLDALIVTGMTDGVMTAGETGVLTDRERALIEERTKRPVGMDTDHRLALRRFDYYMAFALPEKYLVVTRPMSTMDGKVIRAGGPVSDIRELFPDCPEGGSLLSGSLDELPSSPAGALDGLTIRLRAIADGTADDLTDEWKDAFRLLWQDEAWHDRLTEVIARLLPADPGGDKLPPELARRLFGNEKVSITGLESYSRCPYRFFIEHGLRPEDRKEFAVTAQDAGDFYHEALCRYVNKAGADPAWPDISDERADGIAAGIAEELTREWEDGPLRDDESGVWEGEEYVRRFRTAAMALTRQARGSGFRTVYAEHDFGFPDSDWPPLVLTTEDGHRVALEGKIDRIDALDRTDGRYIRVIDNKSSARTLDPGLVAEGAQLQLPLYLKAALEGMPGSRPAGAFYFPVLDPLVEAREDDEDVSREERVKEMKLRGVVLDDPDIVAMMDRGRPGYSIGSVYNKDGKTAVKWALDAETLDALGDKAMEVAAGRCGGIRAGRIGASPLASGSDDPCKNCPVSGACEREKRSPRQAAETDWQALLGRDGRDT